MAGKPIRRAGKSKGKGVKIPEAPRITMSELKRNPKRAVAVFKREYTSIRRMLGVEAEDFQHDKAMQSFHRATLVMLNDLIPIAEEEYRKDRRQGNANTLSTLVSQAREVMNDLRAVQDAENQVEHICDVILRNGLKLLVTNLGTELFEVRTKMGEILDSKKFRSVNALLTDLVTSHGKFLHEVDAKSRSEIEAYLISE